MWTAEVKEPLLDRIAAGGARRRHRLDRGLDGHCSVTDEGRPGPARRSSPQSPTTKVFTEDGREVEPGSGEAGMVAAGGNVPIGYYKDDEKSARTFRVIDGVRYSFPGDWAKVEADGSIDPARPRQPGASTPAARRSSPRRSRRRSSGYAGVDDCLVVGLSRRAVRPAGHGRGRRSPTVPTSREADVIAGCQAAARRATRRRSVVFVAHVPRAPNGKADYRTAKAMAGGPPTP